MKSKVAVFAGTTEGRRLVDFLHTQQIPASVFVTTEYARELLPAGDNLEINVKTLNEDEIRLALQKSEAELVIDATHPFALKITESLSNICAELNLEYIRIVRSEKEGEPSSNEHIYVSSIEEAVEILNSREGNVLAVTGSKELEKYQELTDYKERLYVRVLPSVQALEKCAGLGIGGNHIVCMQGPFGEDINYGLLTQLKADYMVTKESGETGGFQEKVQAACRAGAKLIVIGRTLEEYGLSEEQAVRILSKKYNAVNSSVLKYGTVNSSSEKYKTANYSDMKDKNSNYSFAQPRRIFIIGIGAGNIQCLSEESLNICRQADLIIGAGRMMKVAEQFQVSLFECYDSKKICEYIDKNAQYRKIVVLLSGDPGFCSGAKNLLTKFKQLEVRSSSGDGYNVQVLPAVSSVSYLAAKMQVSWDDAKLLSLHGKQENIIDAVVHNEKVFALMGKNPSVPELCEKFLHFGLKNLVLTVGENLSYQNERILTGVPADFIDKEFSSLSILYIYNAEPKAKTTVQGLPDSYFERTAIPMTKNEVRSISLAKLQLKENSIIYDIGAGTGSVSVEAALRSPQGMVYSIEKNAEAVELIHHNKVKFKTDNIEIIKGTAPEALKGLPVPTHIFIGGTSGNLKEIIGLMLQRAPKARVVMNGITLNTVAEMFECVQMLEVKDLDIVCINVSKAKKAGSYQMMTGQNPVYIFSFTARKAAANELP